MLSVYTRHAQNCDHRDDINWRRCRCPKWIQGVGADGRGQIRITAKTRSWEQAEARARLMDQAADPTKPKIKPAVTVAEAVSNFRADEDGRCLQKTTIAQSKTLFEGLLLNWAKQRGLALLTELTTPELTKFRASWGNGPNTTRRKIPQNQGRKFGERLAQTAADSSFPSAAGAGTPWLLIDGHSLAVSRYWQELFDLDEFKSEMQSGWQTEGSDLLAISSIQILERFEGQGIRLAVLGRTIDLFGRSCDLVACWPEAEQDSLDSAVARSEQRQPQTDMPDSSKNVPMLTKDCIAAGFRPWGETGLYLLNPTHEHPAVLLE